MAPGALDGRYADAVGVMLRRVERQERALLDRAGALAREARSKGARRLMYSMGHVFPHEVEQTAIGRLFRSAAWNAGFRGATPSDAGARGDPVVHIGYQHPPDTLLRAAVVGARTVYVAVRPDRGFVRSRGAVWIDPMWDWPDACVAVDGYDVPVVPVSGVGNGALAWEVYRLAARD